MNYALGYCFNLPDLFHRFPLKKLKLKCKDYRKFACDFHREDIVYKIFKESVKLVINDVIDNNITFKLPVTRDRAEIHMLKVEGKEFKNARKHGKFLDIDFLKSFFTGYHLGLFMHNRTTRVKSIYLTHDLKDKITQNTNNGKLYC